MGFFARFNIYVRGAELYCNYVFTIYLVSSVPEKKFEKPS